MSMSQDENSGIWISLMDYAAKKNVSLSTLRRHIKSNKVTYKIENGRYLLWDGNRSEAKPSFHQSVDTDGTYSARNAIQQLQCELQSAQEEIAELKTLIAFYEESGSQTE